LRDLLMERRVLEQMQRVLSPLRLPKPLLFRTADCDGEINAWFEVDTVTICYEYVAYIGELASDPKRPDWVSERDAFVGPLIDVLLHEAGHAVFSYLNIPLLGREEDAADQFSGYLLLSLGRKQAPGLVGGIAYVYLNEAGLKNFPVRKRWQFKRVDAQQHADAHSTPLQRLYNTVCLASGADADLFQDVLKRSAMPAERAEGCKDEFQQVHHAFRQLIWPHVDRQVLGQVLSSDTLSLGK
ncbi:MAG: DUF4344 domain-containing metallopeptidase, partial [Bosea sp. (in: a-proteobacteria)]